tara:strand:+ start:1819 stop:2037 length:219 start_codon:yes stop_codon:yes gene_type:complete
MPKDLITEYDYKGTGEAYNIIMIREGLETKVTDKNGQVMIINGTEKAMDYITTLNQMGFGHDDRKYLMRAAR